MASIAYICQHEMIEFHRLRGHREIVFLRLSTKKFSKFDVNDYLFFLTKTGNRPQRGVVGFGKLYKYEQLSPRSMWNKYREMTGYANAQEMNDALDFMKKADSPIQKVGGLYLKNVLYFEFPLYLSEFGFNLEPNLESFTYIDQEQDVTSQLLSSIKNVGLDLWSQTQSQPISSGYIETELKRHVLAWAVEKYNFLQSPRNATLDNRLKRLNLDLKKIPLTSQAYTHSVDQKMHCYIPLLRKNQTAISEAIGVACTLSRVGEKHPLLEDSSLKVYLYGMGGLKESLNEQLKLFNILYIDVNEVNE